MTCQLEERGLQPCPAHVPLGGRTRTRVFVNAKFMLCPCSEGPYVLQDKLTHFLFSPLPVFPNKLYSPHPAIIPKNNSNSSSSSPPPQSATSPPLSKVNEAPHPLSNQTPHPLCPRVLVFERNQRKLFISPFSLCLFHLITGITTRFFFPVAFHCKCIVFHLHYELNRLLWASLETQSSFITDMTSLEMGSEFQITDLQMRF